MLVIQIVVMSVLVPAAVVGLVVSSVVGYCAEGANRPLIAVSGFALLALSVAAIVGIVLSGAYGAVLGAFALIVSIILVAALSVLLLFAGVVALEDARELR